MTMFLAIIFLGEPLTLAKSVGAVGIGIGTYLMIQKKETGADDKRVKYGRWLVYAALSALFASLTAIFGKVGIEGVESNLGTAIRTVVVLVMAWLVVFITRKQGELRSIDKKSWLFIVLSGFATGASWLCYYRALQDGQASIVVPIDKLSIVLTIAFSYFFLKEGINRKALFGLALIVAGTLILLF